MINVDCECRLWHAVKYTNIMDSNGTSCRPFDNTSYPFRCPAESIIELLNPRAVGALELVYQPLVVGGGDEGRHYRGDSWFCAAAVQQGLFKPHWGGCGVARQVGGFTNFVGFQQNGVESHTFDTYFPSTYVLDRSTGTNCRDLKYPIMAFNIVMLFALAILFRVRAIELFWISICVGFWHITLTRGPRT